MLWTGFQRPKRLEFDLESLTDRYGKFFAQPFERGFAVTVGHAMRRVLLSSIEGAAITAMKIDGVLHEFSSLPDIIEDTTDLILNLQPRAWLQVDHEALRGTVLQLPTREDIDVEIQEQLIVELYSK